MKHIKEFITVNIILLVIGCLLCYGWLRLLNVRPDVGQACIMFLLIGFASIIISLLAFKK